MARSLTGTIPASLADLLYLTNLNLQNNSLTVSRARVLR